MSEVDGRAQLGAAQVALVAALLAEGTAPPGFDPARLGRQAVALRSKRRRVVAGVRPELPARLGGPAFAELFDTWARRNPPRVGTCAHADADAFAAWAAAEGHPARKRGLLRRRRPA